MHVKLRTCSMLLLLMSACGSDTASEPDGGETPDASATPDAGSVDQSQALFRPDHVLEVSISMAPADFAALRVEPDAIGLPKITCGSQPSDRPYTYFPGEVTVDGTVVGNVGIRKKGSFGSLSTVRPGLKIKANEYVSGQKIFGLKRLTLNNNHQDDSLVSQCLGYSLFRAAGVPSSRCSFAHVTVNGEDLGIYSNVESLKKDFLRRNFSDDSGNLYESGGDLRQGQTDGYQPKTNKSAPDCSDLTGIVDALEVSDSAFPEAVNAVVDVEAFSAYWAMEVLMSHWDGYANALNNHFFYHDPGPDKFYFIPWGIDSLFEKRGRSTRPESVYACGSLPWRLYDVPETKAVYLAKLEELLGSVWDESAILSQVSAMETLLSPYIEVARKEDFASEIQGVRDFVNGRRADIEAELQPSDPIWPFEDGTNSCHIRIGTITASFNTTWDTLDNFATGTATVSGAVAGVSVNSSGFASAGLDADSKGIIRVITELPDGTLAVVLAIIQEQTNVGPGSLPLDFVNVLALMNFYDPVSDTSQGGGLLVNGTISFSSGGTTAGDAIVGTITGEVLEL